MIFALLAAPIAGALPIPIGNEVASATDEGPDDGECSLIELIDIWIWLVVNGEW